jgi:hypothetical protein
VIHPQLSATNSFTVTVQAIHNGPALPAQTNVTVNELTQLVVTNTAVDSDVPPLPLSYLLVNPPAGAAISANGVISWTPAQTQSPGTNQFTTIVTDGSLSATNSFNAFTVQPPPPTLSITLSGINVILSWPSSTDPSFTLFSTPSLLSPNWTSAGAATMVGSQYVVTNAIGGSPASYRLSNQP